jgi:hypothetical protein
MKKNIPTFQFVIDDSEECGVKAISIVGDPAFQSSMITFKKESPKFIVLANKKKKRICAGLSLIPDVPVYRVDEVFGEYYGYFTKETIEKIVEKYHMEMNMNKVNLEHNDNAFIDAFMIEDYIVDTPQRIEDLKLKGIEHPNIEGAWYTAFKIKDEKVFEQIENGEAGMGFSVEAYLDKYIVQMNKNNIKMKKNKKSLLQKIAMVFSDKNIIDEIMNAEIFERALVNELGFEIEWNGVGEPVKQVTLDPNGNEILSPVGPGEFSTDSGVVVVDDASNLLEVRPLPKEVVSKEQSPNIPPVETAPATGDTTSAESMKAYPWDQCISDQLAAGYSQDVADKICGWIKANYSQEEAILKAEAGEVPPTEMVSGDTTNIPSTDVVPTDNMPVEEPVVPVSSASTSKTIADIVGTNDGEYWIKVCVEGGVITEAEVSSETTLLRSQVTKLSEEKKVLEDKLNEPIGDPILQPITEVKPFDKMSAYEKALAKARR